MDLATALSLRISLSLMFLGSVSAGVVALGTHLRMMSEVPLNLWYSILFLAGVSFAKFLYANLRRLDVACIEGASMTACRTTVLESTCEFVKKLSQLIVGARKVRVFNLSNPNDTDEEIGRYLKRLHSYLSSKRARNELSYRRISSVGNSSDVRWTFHALRRFVAAYPLEHVCLSRSSGLFRHLSYLVVEREDGFYTFFFSMLTTGGRKNFVMVHGSEVGRFVQEEFERVWAFVQEQRDPILRHGEINYDVVKRLAARYDCEDSEELRDLLAYRRWYQYTDRWGLRRIVRLLGLG